MYFYNKGEREKLREGGEEREILPIHAHMRTRVNTYIHTYVYELIHSFIAF